MSAEQHTPGPWVAKELHGNYSGYVILREMPCGLRRVDGEKDGRFNAWDARLIAAAPELLAALKRLTKAEDSSSEQFTAKEIDEIEASMNEARAAIAKAEGGAS